MTSDAARTRPVLEPTERIAEVLFGLIMVLTFTGSLSVAEADRAEVRTMLIGALGCNLAWGIIDAVLYVMGIMLSRGSDVLTFRAVRETADWLLRSTRAERAAKAVIQPGRVDVIGAGALILLVLTEETAAAEVVVSEKDILDGIAWSIVEKG